MRLDGWPQPTGRGAVQLAAPAGRVRGGGVHPNGGSAWITTPDHDEYEEDYRNDLDIVGVTFLDDAGRLP
eukprot:5113650-Pyramimonas_sp.AAC.1